MPRINRPLRATVAALAAVLAAALSAVAGMARAAAPSVPADGPMRAEVVHWWTTEGETEAAGALADAWRAAGGTWVDMAVTLGEQARLVAINRIVGGNPPTAAQFNTSRQFVEIVERGLLNPMDEVAARDGWESFLPETVLNAIKVRGHYHAVPLNIHMPTWIWYSKAAFARAGITAEPKTMDELFDALDRLKAAGLVPLAHGGQPWQDSIVFTAVLANVGGRDLYLKVMRDGDRGAIQSAAFRRVLLIFKRLQGYVDNASPGRNWNDATALVITGKAGVQFMGDWAKGEFTHAGQLPGRDYGCIAGFGPASPYIIQGDVFVFPKTRDPATIKAQLKLASVITSPTTQVAFSQRKGSIPIRTDVDVSKLDLCAQLGISIMKDKSRPVGNGGMYMTTEQNEALANALSDYWNRSLPVDRVQADVARILAH